MIAFGTVFAMARLAEGGSPLAAARAVRAGSGDLLLHHPAADEAEAAEGAGVPRSLKVGDQVITTGGIYGQITRLGEQTVQLQIADKVRVEVSRNAIGGYQGQEPVVEPPAIA